MHRLEIARLNDGDPRAARARAAFVHHAPGEDAARFAHHQIADCGRAVAGFDGRLARPIEAGPLDAGDLHGRRLDATIGRFAQHKRAIVSADGSRRSVVIIRAQTRRDERARDARARFIHDAPADFTQQFRRFAHSFDHDFDGFNFGCGRALGGRRGHLDVFGRDDLEPIVFVAHKVAERDFVVAGLHRFAGEFAASVGRIENALALVVATAKWSLGNPDFWPVSPSMRTVPLTMVPRVNSMVPKSTDLGVSVAPGADPVARQRNPFSRPDRPNR